MPAKRFYTLEKNTVSHMFDICAFGTAFRPAELLNSVDWCVIGSRSLTHCIGENNRAEWLQLTDVGKGGGAGLGGA